jgi:hypothetical protein
MYPKEIETSCQTFDIFSSVFITSRHSRTTLQRAAEFWLHFFRQLLLLLAITRHTGQLNIYCKKKRNDIGKTLLVSFSNGLWTVRHGLFKKSVSDTVEYG